MTADSKELIETGVTCVLLGAALKVLTGKKQADNAAQSLDHFGRRIFERQDRQGRKVEIAIDGQPLVNLLKPPRE